MIRRLRRTDVPIATTAFARFLIGKIVFRRFDDGMIASGRIVEVEAYGPGDAASHAFRGRTPRNNSMFLGNFHAYVYFIYGSAFCLNISSEPAGIGAAVLIRALEPLDGRAEMHVRRGSPVADRDLLRGPGRICAALTIDRRLDGADLDSDERLWLAQDGCAPPIGSSTRIGLTRAADLDHRYYACGNRYVSGRRALSPDRPPAGLSDITN